MLNHILKIGQQNFVVSKIKNKNPWTYAISDINGEPVTGRFHEKELQKTSQEKFKIEKIIKIKYYNLYLKWKEYDNSFNI